MPTRSLEQLYQSFLANGDELALEQLLRRSAPTLRRLARRLGAQADDADDLVQETIVAAIQGADRYDPGRPLLPWLKGILTFRAARLARDEVRRRQLHDHAAPPTNAGETAAVIEDRELQAAVHAAIEALPSQYQQPLRHLLLGRTPVEIAQHLGVQRATVRVQLHRGLRRLRILLSRWTAVLFALLLGRGASASARRPVAIAVLGAAVVAFTTLQLLPPTAPAASTTIGTRFEVAADTRRPPTTNAPAAAVERHPLAPSVGTLIVRVEDADNQPVAHVGVTVTPNGRVDPVLHRRRAVTDATGASHFDGLPSGAFSVTTDRGANAEIDLPASGDELRLVVPGGHRVHGRVLDAAAMPVAGAEVWLSNDREGPWRGSDVVTTDAQGAFALEHVADGSFLAARDVQHARSNVHQFRHEAEDTAIALQLGAGSARVRATVLDANERPVPFALLFVGDAADAAPLVLAQGAASWRPPPFECRVDADGRALTSAIEPGRQPWFVRAVGYQPAAGWLEVPALGAVDLVVHLDAGARLQGRVLDDEGRAIDGALAVLRTDDESQSIDVHTDAAGGFLFECAPTGLIDVAARAPGHLARVQSLVLAAGNAAELLLQLPRSRRFCGRVHATSGELPSGSHLRATWPPCQLAPDREELAIADDGSFRFGNETALRPRLALQLAGEPLWRDVDACTAWTGDEADVQLPADFAGSAWLHGSLHGDGGEPLADARLFVCRDQMQWAEIGRSDADGAFQLGPLPPARYALFAETTHRHLPTVTIGDCELAAGERHRIDFTAGATGSVDLTFARADGQPVGDLAITLVDVASRRRALASTAPHLQQTLLPGDYELFVMGSRVQWLEAMPIHVDAGTVTTQRLELPAADRHTLALRGLPHGDGTAALQFRICDRWQQRWTAHYTLPADAPLRLGAVLAPGDYLLTHIAEDGREWSAAFTATGADAHAIVVQLAPR